MVFPRIASPSSGLLMDWGLADWGLADWVGSPRWISCWFLVGGLVVGGLGKRVWEKSAFSTAWRCTTVATGQMAGMDGFSFENGLGATIWRM